ncbi:MAG: glycosyltransferase family 2 protein [Planctomycetes bacterium]|nr:glycosyltransferase family 2 protein [Planctomycetota bacterium]
MMDTKKPRITFGIIVLNGEPFTRYCLRSLYPFAHQIIVVEGGSRHAEKFCTPDGHSIDGTLKVLKQFQAEEDPEDKIEIITRDSFWEEKGEQSQAYAVRATGDWLWQVDIDEFYRPEDMQRLLDLLVEKPEITAAAFHTLTFWGSLEVLVDGLMLRGAGREFRRLFRFGKGYRYSQHRPPTVLDPEGNNLWKGNRFNGVAMEKAGIMLYHYAMLFPQQVLRKCAYYDSLTKGRRLESEWVRRCYQNLQSPYRVHNYYNHLSWLESFSGSHPPQVLAMMEDIRAGRLEVELRPMGDVAELLRKPGYRLGSAVLKSLAPLYGLGLRCWWSRPQWLRLGFYRKTKS